MQKEKKEKRKRNVGCFSVVFSVLILLILAIWYLGLGGGNGNGFLGKGDSKQEKVEETPEIKNYDIELTQDNEIIFNGETLESVETFVNKLKIEVGEDNLNTIIVTIHDEEAIADFLTSVEKALDDAKIKCTVEGKKN